MRRHWKFRRNFARLACFLGAGALIGCEAPKKPLEKPPVPVTVVGVQEYSGPEGVTYSASINPYDQLNVSFKSAGYVTSILQRKGADGRQRNLQQGDWVKRDEVLATVRQSDYQHAVAQAQGQLEQAQAAALKGTQDFGRAQALFASNSLTKIDYDAATAENSANQGALATAQGALAQAQQSLADCELRAPSDGQILSRNIELGVLAATGTAAFTMGDTRRVKAVFGVPDTVLSSVDLGKRQAVRTESFPQEFVGTITAISPQADQKSRTFQVEVTIPNAKGVLKSGMVATLDLGQAKMRVPVMVVPLGAIVAASGGNKAFGVFVIMREGDKDIARRKDIQPGMAYGDRVSITRGLSVGDRVISSGASLLIDGQAVRIIP
ncbi:MAG: efflux RND transporter periplasmic adaptor subunit [Candidatus Acidiferrales bacterium]